MNDEKISKLQQKVKAREPFRFWLNYRTLEINVALSFTFWQITRKATQNLVHLRLPNLVMDHYTKGIATTER